MESSDVGDDVEAEASKNHGHRPPSYLLFQLLRRSNSVTGKSNWINGNKGT